MGRTATEAAKVLIDIYEEFFGNDLGEKYRITWGRMREVCDVRRLNKAYLNELGDELNDLGFSLASFDDYLLVLKESDCAGIRSVSGRIVEKYLPEGTEVVPDDAEDEPDDVEWEDE